MWQRIVQTIDGTMFVWTVLVFLDQMITKEFIVRRRRLRIINRRLKEDNIPVLELLALPQLKIEPL